MLNSPTIPSIFAIITMIVGCQNLTTTKSLSTASMQAIGQYHLCPKGYSFIQKKKNNIICAKPHGSYAKQLLILKKANNNLYYIHKKYPNYTYFSYHKKIWKEHFIVSIEQKYKKRFILNQWQWKCNKHDCDFQTLQSCTKSLTSSPFPSLYKQIKYLQQQPQKMIHTNLLEKLVLQAKLGDFYAKEILNTFEHWFKPQQISYIKAQYYRSSLNHNNSQSCDLTSNPKS